MLTKMKMLAAAGAVIVAGQAQAAPYVYNYLGTAGASTSGSFTIDGTAGNYQLTAFSGKIAGATYSLSDVLLGFDSPTKVYLGGALNGINNITNGTDDFYEILDFTPGTAAFNDTFAYSTAAFGGAGSVAVAFTQSVAPAAAVPEPAMWLTMILGFGLVGGVMRRRQKVSTTVQFA